VEGGFGRKSLSAHQFGDAGHAGVKPQCDILRADRIDEEFQRTSLNNRRRRGSTITRLYRRLAAWSSLGVRQVMRLAPTIWLAPISRIRSAGLTHRRTPVQCVKFPRSILSAVVRSERLSPRTRRVWCWTARSRGADRLRLVARRSGSERRGAPASGEPFEPVSCSNVNISWRTR
jgi:hypothetical protein